MPGHAPPLSKWTHQSGYRTRRAEVDRVIVHVTGPATSAETTACFLRLTAHAVGGGTVVTCLTDFRGSPGPSAIVRVRGTITFRLPHRTLRAAVLIVDRFAPD